MSLTMALVMLVFLINIPLNQSNVLITLLFPFKFETFQQGFVCIESLD